MRKGMKRILSMALAFLMTLSTVLADVHVNARADVSANTVTYTDPVSAEMFNSGDKTVQEAAALTSGTGSVVGQVVALYGSNGVIDTAILEDVIDNEIYGYQIYGKTYVQGLEIGSVVRVTGSFSAYGGVPQMKPSAEIVVVKTRAEVGALIPAQTVTISEILANASDYLSEYVHILGVNVAAKASNNSVVSDDTDKTIKIFKGAEFPEGYETLEGVDLKAVVSAFNGTTQLRNGYTSEYVIDPVTDDMFEAEDKNVKDAAALTSGTISVVGQVAAVYGSNGTLNTIVLEDIIDGEIFGYQVYDRNKAYVSTVEVGSVVKVTGTAGVYGGVPQLSPTDLTVLKTKAEAKAVIGPQVVTIAELLSDIENYLSEYVRINGVSVGEKASNNTLLTDKAGKEINIYQGAELPDMQSAASADVLAVASKYVKNNNTTIQLRNGSSAEYLNIVETDPGEGGGEEEGVEEDTSGVSKGSKFLFFKNSSAEGVFKSFIYGGCAGLVPAKLVDGELTSETDFDGAAAIDYIENSDGTVYLKMGSQYIGANASQQIVLLDKSYHTDKLDTKWIIEHVEGEGYEGYTIKSSTVKYNNKDVYMEYYPSKGFCLYTCKTMSDIYCFHFYDASAYDPDKDGYVGTKKEVVTLPEVGKTYVVYNKTAGAVIGAEVPGIDGNKTTMGVAGATVEGGNITVQNGGMIFTIVKSGDYVRLKSGNKFLCTDNTEAVYMAEEGSLPTDTSCIDWTLEATTEGVLLKNATANYNGSPIYVEYFSGGFSGYTVKAGSIDIFLFDFYEYNDQYNLGYVVNPSVEFKTTASANLGVDFEMNYELLDLGTITSVSATVTFEDNTTKTVSTSVDKSYLGKVTVPSDYLTGHTSMKIKVEVTSAETETVILNYSGSKDVEILDEPVITGVSPSAGEQTGENKKPVIKIAYANIGAGPVATLKLNGTEVTLTNNVTGKYFSYAPTGNMADGKYVAEVEIVRKDGKKATKQWVFYVGQEGVSAYFGQIHSHTAQYSDGSGTLDQAFTYASTQASDIDYMIVTDHSNYFDTTASSIKDSIYNPACSSLLLSETVVDGKTLTKWEEAKEIAKKYSEDGKFVSAYGYEMTWSGGPGHINVFNSLGIVSRNNTELNNKTNYSGMYAFYDLLVDANSKEATWLDNSSISAMFNHPGTTFGTFGDFAGYTPERDAIMNLIEVGNGDGAVGSTAYFPSYEYYDMALAYGWHIAPTNGQDNHKGAWGDANTCRTVVLAESLTEAAIYDAMALRHVYSTEDQNLSVLYYLNDALQGDIIPDYEDSKVKFNVTLSDKDTEELGYVYVIGENGKIRYTSDFISGNTADLEFELENTDAYYYIKVVEKDGDIAVTAPVWVADVNDKKAKVESSMDIDVPEGEKNPVEGEKTVITDVIKNKEESNIDVNSYVIYVDGKEVFNSTTPVANSSSFPTANRATALKTLAPGETYTVSYEWTPDSYGTHEIQIVFGLKVNGEDTEYTSKKNVYVQGVDYHTVSTIDKLHAGNEYEEFTIEGIITANTSGYDKDTAFFDCTYIQDATGGINVFPVSGNFQIGQKVRAHGAITYYNGEIELNISEDYGGYIEVISEEITPVDPVKVTCKEAMADENVGLLMQISGTVTKVNVVEGVIDRIYVNDGSGKEACIYINGYIKNSVTNDTLFGKDGVTIKVGDYITAVGIGSIDVDELGEVEYLHRLRVRNRSEIVLSTQGGSENGNNNGGSENGNNNGGNENGNNNGSNTTPIKPGKMGDYDTSHWSVIIMLLGLGLAGYAVKRRKQKEA